MLELVVAAAWQVVRFAAMLCALALVILLWSAVTGPPTDLGLAVFAVVAVTLGCSLLYGILVVVVASAARYAEPPLAPGRRSAWMDLLTDPWRGRLAAGIAVGLTWAALLSPLASWTPVVLWRYHERVAGPVAIGEAFTQSNTAGGWLAVIVVILAAGIVGFGVAMTGNGRRRGWRALGVLGATVVVATLLPWQLFGSTRAPSFHADHQADLIVDGQVVGHVWAASTLANSGSRPLVEQYSAVVASANQRDVRIERWLQRTDAVAFISRPRRCGGPLSLALGTMADVDSTSRSQSSLYLMQAPRQGRPIYTRDRHGRALAARSACVDA